MFAQFARHFISSLWNLVRLWEHMAGQGWKLNALQCTVYTTEQYSAKSMPRSCKLTFLRRCETEAMTTQLYCTVSGNSPDSGRRLAAWLMRLRWAREWWPDTKEPCSGLVSSEAVSFTLPSRKIGLIPIFLACLTFFASSSFLDQGSPVTGATWGLRFKLIGTHSSRDDDQ